MQNHEEQFDNARTFHMSHLFLFRHPGCQFAYRLEKESVYYLVDLFLFFHVSKWLTGS